VPLCPPSVPAGFPGESDEAHRELVDFVREFKFERMGAFAYSEEDGTPAADLPEQLPQRVRCVHGHSTCSGPVVQAQPA
jgi:tRNA A37 methylthiotransferase MiaB